MTHGRVHSSSREVGLKDRMFALLQKTCTYIFLGEKEDGMRADLESRNAKSLKRNSNAWIKTKQSINFFEDLDITTMNTWIVEVVVQRQQCRNPKSHMKPM